MTTVHSDAKTGNPRLALGPSPYRACPIPCGLMSLWEMLRLHAESYVSIAYWLTQMEIVYLDTDSKGLTTIAYRTARRGRQPASEDLSGVTVNRKPFFGPLEKDSLKDLKAMTVKVAGYCSHYGLKGTESILTRIADEIRLHQPNVDNFPDLLTHTFSEVAHRFRDEMSEHLYLKVEQDRVPSYIDSNQLGPEVSAAFPAAVDDAKEARRCYALEAHHASIYHSMMVLEVGLPAFAKRFGVKVNPNKSTWGPLIEKIDKSIKTQLDDLDLARRGRQGKKPMAPKIAARRIAVLAPAQEAALEFRHFKDVWRDHIAHGRARYDRHDALKALEHVETFMRLLATELKLSQVRVA